MTQTELAEKSGLTRGYIGQVETGLIKVGSRETFLGLAKGLNMSLDEFQAVVSGQKHIPVESPDQLLERFRLAQPIAVPILKEFALHAGRVAEPHDYVYLPRSGRVGKNVEAYRVEGNCLAPKIEEGDIVVIDRDRSVDPGNIVACLYAGELHLGRLKKIGDESFIENGHGRFKLDECPVAATVIQVIKNTV